MPGNEETGLKSIARKSCDYSAGVPIKKRRFPLYQPPSPTEEATPLPAETDPEQKGHSSPSQGSAVTDASRFLSHSNASSLSASSSSASVAANSISTYVAAMSSLSSNAASLNASGIVVSSIATGTAAVSSASITGPISNARGISADSNPGIAGRDSNANIGAAGSNAATSVADGLIASKLVAGSVARSVAVFSNCCVPEGNKTILSEHGDDSSVVKNAITHSKIKQEPSLALCSGSLAEIDREEKPLAARESANDMFNGAKTELNLATVESSTLEVGKQIPEQEKVGGQCKLRVATAASRKTELCLGFSHHSSAVMVAQSSETCHDNKENTESVSLSLSLNKGDFGVQQRSGNGHADIEGANMMANRSNWDLNMTMDAWEGPNNNDGAGEKVTLGSNPDVSKPDLMIAIHSAGMDGAGLPSESHISEETDKSSASAMASTPFDANADYSLCLGFDSSVVQLNLGRKPLSLSAKLDASSNCANISGSSANTGAVRIVKSEQLDDRHCSTSYAVQPNLDIRRVKHELVESRNLEDPKSINFASLKSADLRLVKPEATQDVNQEEPKKTERSPTMLMLDELMPPTLNNVGIPSSSKVFLKGNAPSDGVEQDVHSDVAIPEVKSAQDVFGDQHASGMVSASDAFHESQSNVSGRTDDCMEDSKATDNDVQDGNALVLATPGTVEGSVSEDEKINLSEETSFVSDYESDENPNLVMDMDAVRDDAEEDIYEDGEVREPSVSTGIELSMCEKMEAQLDNTADTVHVVKQFGVAGENHPPLPCIEEDMKIKDPAEIDNDNSRDCIQISSNQRSINDAIKDASLPEASRVQMPADGNEEKGPVEFTYKEALDLSGKKETSTEQEAEQTSNDVSNASQETSVTVGQGTEESGKRSDVEGKNNSALSKSGTHLNGNSVAKDANCGGTRSRIINLSRASNSSSPGKTRSISGSLLSSRVGRERLPDVALEGDKVQVRGRDFYGDGSRKLSRERHQNQSSRSSRLIYPRGRGRFSSRIGLLCSGRDSGHDFDPEFYDGSTVCRVARHKYASSIADQDPDLNSYDGHNGAFFVTGRGGRKFFKDNSSTFSHLTARRRSPGDRDGPTSRGLPVIRRVPRNISPSRCTDEEETELAGLRHVRSFPDGRSGPVVTRSQPYEELDGSFGRGNRDFQSLQRRGIHRIRSKSPIRHRTRSPGPWSSPGRISQDAFGGASELPPRRSSPIYRMQRIMSPERPCFPREMVVRRHGSPPFVSRTPNDLREMDSARDHGHLRSAIPNRSPSGQVLLRNSRRLDLMDPRERTDGDNYYRGPVNSGGFHELGSDDNNSDRRRFGERQGPVRHFRHPYSSVVVGEDFLLNSEDGPRTYRFCPEDDSAYHESGNMRGRQFDRRIKHRLGDASTGTRSIGEQEETFRHGTGQVWHEDRFDDMSRVKRKRF